MQLLMHLPALFSFQMTVFSSQGCMLLVSPKWGIDALPISFPVEHT